MSYDEKSIEILENRDAVRKRPGMFIGGTGKKGLHHVLWEIVDNSVDEAMNGHASEIEVTLHDDGRTVTVRDDGRGIPVAEHEEAGKSALVVILTVLHAGGKFNQDSYKASGGLHGVGAAVTNFLSAKMVARVWRDEKVHRVDFQEGKPQGEVEVVDEYSKYSNSVSSGTEITFRPDEEIFDTLDFDTETIQETLETKTYINSGLKIVFQDEKNDETYEFQHEEGIHEYLERMISQEDEVEPIHEDIIHFDGEVEDIQFNVAFKWTTHTNDHYASFVNAIPTKGGTHQKGFQKGLSAAVKSYIDQAGIGPKKLSVKSRDTREGLFAVVNLFVEGEVQFQGQTKEEFNNPEVEGQIRSYIRDELGQFFLSHSETAENISNRVIQAAKARRKSRSNIDKNLKKKSKRRADLPAKLADCTSNNPNEAELFLVEGASAGGNAKQARDRKTQAILPLRGKVLNSEGKTSKRVLKNKELSNIVKVLGTGIGDQFDLSHLRYGKIILLMDADSDGHHISTLLLTFFYRHFPDLIREGHVYIAQPPLYQIKKGTDRYWALSDSEKDKIVDDLGNTQNITVSRFKGLGEMMKDALKETTLDPQQRKLIQVDVPDSKRDLTDQTISDLMGSKSRRRYEIIKDNLEMIEELDI